VATADDAGAGHARLAHPEIATTTGARSNAYRAEAGRASGLTKVVMETAGG
jgi:hypothetical protein